MGCLRAPSDRPLTTADLERMAVGRLLLARLERLGDGAAVSFVEGDSSAAPSGILRSLAPVISHKAAVGDMKAEYVFVFQSGRDPIVFHINVRGDALRYRVGAVDYEGGSAEDFLRAAEPPLR